MLAQGRTAIAAEDVAQFGEMLRGAVWRDVAWMTEDGRRALTEDEVDEVLVVFRDEEEGPVLTAYLDPTRAPDADDL